MLARITSSPAGRRRSCHSQRPALLELALAPAVAALFTDYLASRNLSARTQAHERHLFARHLGAIEARRAQDVTAAELARLLHGLRDRYSPWTCVAVHRIIHGAFSLGLLRGILTRPPADGLAPSEVPRQQNRRSARRART